MMTRLAGLVCLAAVAAGCGSRCKEVGAARDALSARPAGPGRTADVRVTLPFAQVNPVIADLLRAKPLSVALTLPDLGAIKLEVQDRVTATATEVQLEPGPPNAIRFATRIAVRDGEREVTTLAAKIDVVPSLVRHPQGAELVIGFGPKDLVSVRPELGADAKARLGDLVERQLPARLRGKVPRFLLDEAAGKLATYLGGAAFDGLRETLFARLGELTTWRLQLPDVPVAQHTIRSTDGTAVVEILTDLRVRRGLGPATARGEVTVELSGSAAAELANWMIDRGHVPRWYDDGLKPKRDGDFTPRFDYVADDSHPLKIYLFQERGGCSYFRVGVQPSIGMRGDMLDAVALDRAIEASSANPIIEVAAAVKYFLFGWIDQSKQIAAHTRLIIGGRPLDARVTSAALDGGELRFGLAFAAPTTSVADSSSRRR